MERSIEWARSSGGEHGRTLWGPPHEVKVHLSVYRGQGVGEHVTHLCSPWLRSSALVKPITIVENRRREPELW